MLTPQQLIYAREWIIECASCGCFSDLDEEQALDLTDLEVTKAIARHYSGGLESFIYFDNLSSETT